jgi:hypothetical protein
MRMFIRIVDGQPSGNPIIDENFREAFPDVDMNNLPEGFAEFIRVEPPITGPFEVCENCTYEKVGDKYTDVHHVRPMTEGEKAAKIEQLKTMKPGDNWRWDEAKLIYLPPLIPTTGGPWRFDTQARGWVVATEPPFPSWVLRDDGLIYIAPIPRPQDGKRYRWDEPTLSWVLLNV